MFELSFYLLSLYLTHEGLKSSAKTNTIMIDPKELRLGNFVSLLGKVVQVQGIDDASIITDTEITDGRPVHYSCSMLDPVFLTSEVLKKCGVLYSERDRYEIALPTCEYDEMFGNSKQIVFIKRMIPETAQSF